jgi:ribosome biogenesis GTPase
MANAEQILLVFAFAEPDLDAHQLTRFLVKAESTQLGVSLCLNKQDLVTENKQEEWQARLASWGYKPILISVAENKGIEALTSYLGEKITILSGPSGVGKSSLINRLIPDLELRVSQVSGKLSRGRHTTRHVELFELPGGGFIADSPGFNQPDLHCTPADLVDYFPEAREKLEQERCQFSNCLHSHEPNCAVRGDWERYQFYLKFLAEAIAQEEIQRQKSPEESRLKLKIKSSGERHYEPKLETKKYRRRSRRSRNQNIQDFFEDNYED